jgi:hypothetical protein
MPIDFETQLSRIPEKLDTARSKGCECFGSESHRFRLNPPLPESEVSAFEEKHRIRLPADYRSFLVTIGNGGAGPYYGVNRLENWQGWFDEQAEADDDFLAKPCPIVYAAAIRQDWAESLPSTWWEWGVGSLAISDQGCTYEARLIVNGPSRGRVVYLDAQAARRFRPYFVKDACFLDWYERWLDAVLNKQPIFWFGVDNPDYS